MIELKPHFLFTSSCPTCQSSLTINKELIFTGHRILLFNACNDCGQQYYGDLPVGHAAYYPSKIDTHGKLFVSKQRPINWFDKSLTKAFQSKNHKQLSIEKANNGKTYDSYVFINCIDSYYGHVLLKLFNAQFYNQFHPNLGIIVLIQQSFKWLVPTYVAETWSVDIKLREGNHWYSSLNEKLQPEFDRFPNLYISPAYSHPNLHKLYIEDFTGVKPFDIHKFGFLPLTITFIYREDRLWNSSQNVDKLLEICKRKKILKPIAGIFIKIQKNKIQSFVNLIAKLDFGIQLNVVGIGNKKLKFTNATNYIEQNINFETEKKWAAIYAKSHLVIGVHGSNMLLPTAHAGGFVELLPENRIGNITQDVFTRYKDRQMLYLGRFLPISSSTHLLAKVVENILKNYSIFNLYTDEQYLAYDFSYNSSLLNEKFAHLSKP